MAEEPLMDPEKLRAYLARTLGEGHPLSFTGQTASGSSNLTYFFNWGDAEWVIRRPPPGPLPPGAHNVLREYTVLKALARTDVPVPRPIATCEDESVIGAPFYVMERVHGFVPLFEPSPLLEDPKTRHQMGIALMEAIAKVHRVDYVAVGLGDFGRPQGFVERQIRRRFEQLETIMARCRELPDMVRIRDWLAANVPPENERTSLVHGDYSLANVMFAHETPPRLVAIFDWEIAAIGDPLTDVGWILISPGNRQMWELEGFPDEAELIAAYEETAGQKMRHLPFYKVFALWRLVIALEGSYARYVSGTDRREQFARFGEGNLELIRRAVEIAGIR
jgi:aminoglycoside phosphotransferase (APT) family kinase protein